MASCAGPVARPALWCASDALSERAKRLRDEYFSFETRVFRNEVLPFTTGTSWDSVYSCCRWTNVPEVMPFLPAFEDSLLAAARVVPLPSTFWREPLIVRAAMFFGEVVRSHLPVHILDGELIVGGHCNVAMSLCLDRREASRRKRTARSAFARIRHSSERGLGNCGAVPGHLIPDYPSVLRRGLRGIVGDIDAALEIDRTQDERDALRAFRIACYAARAFTERYAAEAVRAAETASAGRAAELTEIARVCVKAPWEPAETFHEALQSLWFTHMLVLISESYPGPGVSFGRFDQFLYPYYAADIEAGRLTRDHARELLRCFWVKPNYAYDYQGRLGRNQGINSSFGQLITLGGCGPDGDDSANDLTYLCLDVIEEMNLLEPKPNIRLHAKTPDKLMRRICGMLAKSQGAPFLLNFDENSMRGLRWEGVPERDLWDYAPVGCLENTRQGDDRSGTVDVNFNLAKPVELTLFQGRDLATGEQVGPVTPDPRTMTDWSDFVRAFRTQLSAALKHLIDLNNQADSIRALYEPTPYLSALVGGCIEKGKDVTAGGARYNFITVEGVALATAA
ncbi:MAG: hypothetical protein FJY92_06030, partial [Candidatus Hydrogenedentes bacterium]|nr:hypothetical protein [Candidatus Hydrogenedentota bacterium]